MSGPRRVSRRTFQKHLTREQIIAKLPVLGEYHPSGRDPSVDKLLEEFSGDSTQACICVSAFHVKAGCPVHNPAPQHRRVRDAVGIPQSKGRARRMGVEYPPEPLIRREDVVDESGQVDPCKVREAAVRKKKEVLEEYFAREDRPVSQFFQFQISGTTMPM